MTPTQLVKAVQTKLRRESLQRQRQITHAKRIIAIGRCAGGGAFQVVSDPVWERWQADGASSCGATWDGGYDDVVPAEQREDYIGD